VPIHFFADGHAELLAVPADAAGLPAYKRVDPVERSPVGDAAVAVVLRTRVFEAETLVIGRYGHRYTVYVEVGS
jgi:hypothetical protein